MVELTTEDSIEEFFGKNDEVWSGDYQTRLFKNEDVPKIDDHYKALKFKTRIVAFIFDKSEYKEEVKHIKTAAKYLATRDNLRVAMVDDVRLIKKFKLKYG